MALITGRDNIPEIGDTVESLKWSRDKLAVWITFKSGKTVICHVTEDKANGIVLNSHLIPKNKVKLLDTDAKA
jgi:hypothetical protein